MYANTANPVTMATIGTTASSPGTSANTLVVIMESIAGAAIITMATGITASEPSTGAMATRGRTMAILGTMAEAV